MQQECLSKEYDPLTLFTAYANGEVTEEPKGRGRYEDEENPSDSEVGFRNCPSVYLVYAHTLLSQPSHRPCKVRMDCALVRHLARSWWSFPHNLDDLIDPSLSDPTPKQMNKSNETLPEQHTLESGQTGESARTGPLARQNGMEPTYEATGVSASGYRHRETQEIKKLRSENKNLRDQRRELRKAKRSMEDKIFSLEQANNELGSRLRSLTRWREDAEVKMCQDAQTITTQSEEIVAYKDDLFKLQPRLGLPDTDIISSYSRLCNRISLWAGREIDILEANPGALGSQLRRGIVGNDRWLSTLLERCSYSWEHLLIAVIHESLQNILLSDKLLLFGLSDSMAQTISRIERSMEDQGRRLGRFPVESRKEPC